mgnify:CR=1 FL=1
MPLRDSQPSGLHRVLDSTFEDTLARVQEQLWVEGLGVVREFDVKAALEQQLGVKQEPYTIVWVWNPTLTDAALLYEPHAGYILPSRILIRRQQGRVLVSALDPVAATVLLDRKEICPIALSMRERLERALAAL